MKKFVGVLIHTTGQGVWTKVEQGKILSPLRELQEGQDPAWAAVACVLDETGLEVDQDYLKDLGTLDLHQEGCKVHWFASNIGHVLPKGFTVTYSFDKEGLQYPFGISETVGEWKKRTRVA